MLGKAREFVDCASGRQKQGRREGKKELSLMKKATNMCKLMSTAE
jgi:hypothetical protein